MRNILPQPLAARPQYVDTNVEWIKDNTLFHPIAHFFGTIANLPHHYKRIAQLQFSVQKVHNTAVEITSVEGRALLKYTRSAGEAGSVWSDGTANQIERFRVCTWIDALVPTAPADAHTAVEDLKNGKKKKKKGKRKARPLLLLLLLLLLLHVRCGAGCGRGGMGA